MKKYTPTDKADQVKEITDKLEQGIKEVFTSDRYINFLNAMSKFTSYSANNCLLIMMQCPTATLVHGFKAWQTDFNRHVKKGEKAIKILAPCPFKIKKEIENEQGILEEKEITIPRFKAIPVFDIAQTEGEAMPTICEVLTDEVKDYEAMMKAIQEVAPVEIKVIPIEGNSHGYFHTVDKYIAIDEGMSQAQTIKTAIHETAHAILHNKEEGQEKDAKRNTKEVQAESVAYTVCKYFGLDTSDYSFEYIASWSKGKDTKELQKSLAVIQTTAQNIIEGIEKNLVA